jgi:Protein of unknown function (DUF2550)
MGGLVTPVLDVLLVCFAICVVPLLIALRRLLLTRPVGTFECSVRRDRTTWTPGVARYEPDRLDWYRLLSLTTRPSRSLPRAHMLILDRRVPANNEHGSVLPGWVVIRCATQDGDTCDTVELAMSAPAYTGLATWIESAPPGQHVNFA